MMTENIKKRILIVDDEPNLVLMLATSLQKLGTEYIIETAYDSNDALAKMQENVFQLLITDYNMPGINGLDLAQMVHQVSPETQVILMTAYGTNKLRQAIKHTNINGYIDKPFSLTEIRKIVERAVEQTNQPQKNKSISLAPESTFEQAVQEYLVELQNNTGAWCTLLLSSNGYPISEVGQTNSLNVANVSALIAANFIAAAELANLLGNHNSVFKSSYHEGEDYNIYAYKVNADLLLTVIFGAEKKPGMIWFYTKQIAAEILPLAAKHPPPVNFIVDEGTDTNTEVNAILDGLFSENELDEDNFDSVFFEDNVIETEPNSVKNKESNLKTIQSTTTLDNNCTSPTKPMSFEEAIAAGLVPTQILDRELKS